MKIISVSCSFDNYSYLLICEQTGKAAVVDPTEAYPVMMECDKRGAELTAVLCTHHHQDHIGDIGEIVQQHREIEIICHGSDSARISKANVYVNHDDTVSIGNLQGQVLHTPGHTTGSICYDFGGVVFTGDTLFGGGCGRLFEGTPKQMMQSLDMMVQRCADSTELFFGHEYTVKNLEFALTVEPDNTDAIQRLALLKSGDGISTPSTLHLEKKTNPFLRTSKESIKKGLELRGVQGVDSPLSVFTQLRLLRNAF